MASVCQVCLSHEAHLPQSTTTPHRSFHSTVPGYGNSSSSSSTTILPASTPRCLPYVKASSLAISPPGLVPTRVTKNQLPFILCPRHKGNSHIHTMPVSMQNALHPHQPALLPLSNYFPLLRKAEEQLETHCPSVYTIEGKNTRLFHCSTGMWVIPFECPHYLNWRQSAHLSSSWWKSFSPATVYFPWCPWCWQHSLYPLRLYTS